MSAFPAWSPISPEDVLSYPGINTQERQALTKAGESFGNDSEAIMTAACREISSHIRAMLGNNRANQESLNNTGLYDIPFSMRVVAWPLIVRWLFVRYQIPLSKPREDSVLRSEELLTRYADAELVPEQSDGNAPQDPAYMMPRYTRRQSFSEVTGVYRRGGGGVFNAPR